MNVIRCTEPWWFRVGTGESGINDVAGRVKVGKAKFDPLYGIKIGGDVSGLISNLYKDCGINMTVPLIHYRPFCGSTFGRAFIRLNTVALFRPTIGILTHELSHLVAWKMFNDNGHKQGFKACYRLLHSGIYKVMGLNADSEKSYMMRLMQEHNLF